MRLHSLEVEDFRAIQSARLLFGRGLNVVYGPNDLGKSTLTEAIRAALLIAPASAEARSFATWGAAAGQSPRVLISFECQGATWRVEKVFAQGSRAKAYLQKSTDGGTRYHMHAQGRDVEGKLRELLKWGLAAPGGRGTQRAETYLTTALLGKQGEVSAIFDASLKRDQDETGRALVTRALDALGQDPIVTRLLDRLKERSGEVYTPGGRIRRTADSPLVRAQAELKEREERLRVLQESSRQGKEIEEQVCRLLQARETALDERDQARGGLDKLSGYAASTAKREQLDRVVNQHLRDFERITLAFNALEAARQEHLSAQAALTVVGDEYEQAVNAANVADAEAQVVRNRLARARSAHESSEELASSARGARVSDLRARLEKAAARKTAAHAAVTVRAELASLESQFAAAQIVLDEAQEEVVRASAELNMAFALEQLREARILTDAVESAASDQEKQTARELAAAAAVAEADAALKAAAATLEDARDVEKQSRRAVDERAMNVRLLDARILHCEATVRDEREALERAKTTVLRMRRADEAQVAAAAAEAKAAEIDASLAVNAAEIARCEAKLHVLESIALELRRRAIASKVDELSAQEGNAREHRRRAAEVRDSAARLNTTT
jgi:AAA domain